MKPVAVIVVGCGLTASLAVPAFSGPGRVEELTLESRVFGNTRQIRVLLPPSYDEAPSAERHYPVFYFLDGIAAFSGWGLVEVAADLWARSEIEEVVFVGVDNGGSTVETTHPVRDRAAEYLPYPDPTWTGDDAPEPRGDRMPEFLFDEVAPLVEGRYRIRAGSANIGLAGDSYAGAAALYTATRHPAGLAWLLVESPPLHVGDGRLLAELEVVDSWPGSVYLGVGTAEGETAETRRRTVETVRALDAAIARRSPGTRRHLEVREGGTHWYDAWRERLPTALRFLIPASAPIEEECPSPLAEALAAPGDAFPTRLHATGEGGLGTPLRVAVEVGPNRHELGEGRFLPLVRYRLKYRHLELEYQQAATGGQEWLTAVELSAPETTLFLPFAFGDTKDAVRAALGPPGDASSEVLSYDCPNGVAGDHLELHFHRGALTRAAWRFVGD